MPTCKLLKQCFEIYQRCCMRNPIMETLTIWYRQIYKWTIYILFKLLTINLLLCYNTRSYVILRDSFISLKIGLHVNTLTLACEQALHFWASKFQPIKTLRSIFTSEKKSYDQSNAVKSINLHVGWSYIAVNLTSVWQNENLWSVLDLLRQKDLAIPCQWRHSGLQVLQRHKVALKTVWNMYTI